MRTFSMETALDDYVESRESEMRGHDADMADFRSQLQDRFSPSTTKRPLGMRPGGSMNFLGSIPFEIWNADTYLRPSLSDGDRARDILRRHPRFKLDPR